MTGSNAVGSGTPSYRFGHVEGVVRRFSDPSDVIAAFDDDLSSTIALVSSGGTTFLSPILGRLGGIIALDGSLRSHLAIVSREFDVPCLVGAALDSDVTDGTAVRLTVIDENRASIDLLPEGAVL